MDISLTGAKVRVSDRRGILEELRSGQSAVLQWAEFEMFGALIWVEGDICGIHFDEVVLPRVLIKTRDLEDQYAAGGRGRGDLLKATREWVQGPGR